MRHALTAAQMREVEDRAVEDGLATIAELMDRAGAAVAAAVAGRVPTGPIVVVCGSGNNAGDGWVAARLLSEAGRDVCVITTNSPERLPEAAASAAKRAGAAGVAWLAATERERCAVVIGEAACVIDALFGFGMHGPVTGDAAALIDEINGSGAFVVAADVPSGVEVDTGVVGSVAVIAALTVTFTALKPGLMMLPGASHVGEIMVADIGISPGSWCGTGTLELPDVADLRALFPDTRPLDHKGSRGRVAVVAGSAAYPGAAALCVEGALRMGAGYVTLVTTEEAARVTRALHPSALVRVVPGDESGAIADAAAALEAVQDADAIVIGPGLTTGEGPTSVVCELLERAFQPLVADADALNICASRLGGSRRSATTVLTPHPGELARLTGLTPAEVQADRVSAARRFAGPDRTCLLKGARSIVAGEGRTGIVLAGNAGLARAGSGDVLAGMIGTLLAQGLAGYEAALLGAYLHGWAAEAGSEELTETCFTSADITRFLPHAVRRLLGG